MFESWGRVVYARRRLVLVLAAIVAATGLRTVHRDVESMEKEWAARAATPVS